MIEAAPRSLFSGDFVLRSGGRQIAELRLSSWRERAELDVDGARHRLYREGLLGGDFVLERDGTVVARAEKPSAWHDRFEVRMDGRAFTLKRNAWLGADFGVFAGETRVGEIAPAGFFRRRIEIRLPADWPVAVQAFAFWLAQVIWNRETEE